MPHSDLAPLPDPIQLMSPLPRPDSNCAPAAQTRFKLCPPSQTRLKSGPCPIMETSSDNCSPHGDGLFFQAQQPDMLCQRDILLLARHSAFEMSKSHVKSCKFGGQISNCAGTLSYLLIFIFIIVGDPW